MTRVFLSSLFMFDCSKSPYSDPRLRRILSSIFILLCLLLPIESSAKRHVSPQQADSLYKVWTDTSAADSSRLKALYSYARYSYEIHDPDSSIYYGQLLLEMAKKVEDQSMIDKAFYRIAYWYTIHSQYDSALKYYDQILDLQLALKDSIQIARTLNLKGSVEKTKGNYDLAIEYLNKSLEISQLTHSEHGIAEAYHTLGVVYKYKGNYDQAIDYLNRALKIREKLDRKFEISSTYNRIGQVYFDQANYDKALENYMKSYEIRNKMDHRTGMSWSLQSIGDIHFVKGDYPKAIENYKESLRLKQELGNVGGVAKSFKKLAECYEQLFEFEKSLDYLNQSIEIQKNIQSNQIKANTLLDLGRVNRKIGHLNLALDYSSSSLDLAQEIGAPIDIREASKELWITYKKLGLFEKSLDMYELYRTTNDSIESEKNRKEIIRQELKYSYEKRAALDSIQYAQEKELSDAIIAQKNAELNEQRILQLTLMGGLILFLIFGAILFNRYRLTRQQKEIIEEQKEELVRTQSQLIQSEKMASLGMLTSGIAHEINNPVNYIASGADGLKMNFEELTELMDLYDQLEGNENDQKVLEKIKAYKNEIELEELTENTEQVLLDMQEGVDRIADIVKGLQTYNNSGRADRIAVDLHEVIESSLRLLRPMLKDHLRIIKEFDQKPEELIANKGELGQVIMNLIANAAQAIEESGRKDGFIRIRTSFQDPVKVEIQDNGCGMTADTINHLFDPFFTTKDVGQGQGLGMSTSLGIIRAHGGTIDVKSELGKGSILSISIPKG